MPMSHDTYQAILLVDTLEEDAYGIYTFEVNNGIGEPLTITLTLQQEGESNNYVLQILRLLCHCNCCYISMFQVLS